jgi:hypothetical protein
VLIKTSTTKSCQALPKARIKSDKAGNKKERMNICSREKLKQMLLGSLSLSDKIMLKITYEIN